jgi:hypothetical protein
MECVDECTRNMYRFGFSKILSTIHRRFLENRKFYHGTVEEKQEFCMDKRNAHNHFEGSSNF